MMFLDEMYSTSSSPGTDAMSVNAYVPVAHMTQVPLMSIVHLDNVVSRALDLAIFGLPAEM